MRNNRRPSLRPGLAPRLGRRRHFISMLTFTIKRNNRLPSPIHGLAPRLGRRRHFISMLTFTIKRSDHYDNYDNYDKEKHKGTLTIKGIRATITLHIRKNSRRLITLKHYYNISIYKEAEAEHSRDIRDFELVSTKLVRVAAIYSKFYSNCLDAELKDIFDMPNSDIED